MSPPAWKLTDGSKRDNEVLMAILLACWRWLLPAQGVPVSPALTDGAFAAAPLAAHPPRRALAPIPAPLPRLLS